MNGPRVPVFLPEKLRIGFQEPLDLSAMAGLCGQEHFPQIGKDLIWSDKAQPFRSLSHLHIYLIPPLYMDHIYTAYTPLEILFKPHIHPTTYTKIIPKPHIHQRGVYAYMHKSMTGIICSVISAKQSCRTALRSRGFRAPAGTHRGASPGR